MKKFIFNLKKYYKYSLYSAKAELKSEVANSYLNWLWWILDPFFFMLIYTFISQIVFKDNEPYFPIFVFIGLSGWNFFSKMVSCCIKLISDNENIVTKTYIPKYILLLSKSFTLVFKSFISFALVIILMIFFKVPFTLNLLWFPLIFLILYIFTFGICTILMHLGIYIEDLFNVVDILLKFTFYMSGVFYSLQKNVPEPFNKYLLEYNPVAFLISEFRNIMMYNQMPNFLLLLFWLLFGILLCFIGIRMINKYEDSYARVI